MVSTNNTLESPTSLYSHTNEPTPGIDICTVLSSSP
jgi:hypothetical protein